MTNLNTANQDEIALDDLFAQIEGLDDLDGLDLPPIVEAVPAEAVQVEPETAPVEVVADGLDDIDALVAEMSEPTAVVEANEANEANDFSALDDLFDESSLELDDIALSLPVESAVEPEVEVKPKAESKPKATPKPKKESAPNTERTTYYNSSKSKVLLDRLGGDTSDIVLEFADADLSDEDLAKKQRAFLSLLNNQPTVNSDGQTVQKKVAEKVVILFTMFKQKKSWNEVMQRTFKLLLEDGYITSGKGGNLQQSLLAKPYSPGTASAQAGQMMQMLPLLKITKEENGRLVPNEDSTILARLKAEYFPELEVKA